MKVLLLHPEDTFPVCRAGEWDLIVDLGQAPPGTYEAWSRQAGCRVEGLSSYARGFEDIYSLRSAVQDARNKVIDKSGTDWWEILFPMLMPELEQSLMLRRLAEEIGPVKGLYSTQPDPRVSALQQFLGVEARFFKDGPSRLAQTINRYGKAFSNLDLGQLIQVVQDKFDSQHAIRRRLAGRRVSGETAFFLLPSAYINTSRMAVAYAAMLPEKQFLLVTARRSGKLPKLPANVHMTSLDAYFDHVNESELSSLFVKWGDQQRRLVQDHAEFRFAESLGMFRRLPWLMRWAIAARDAWKRLFDATKIQGCLSADDANPYSSLPLVIASQRGIPTLAVHHGALDYRMAMKDLHSDFYLAKGKMEHDFLLHVCHVDPIRIVFGAPQRTLPKPASSGDRPWLVFFSEPYGSAGWRMEDVYKDLLTDLCALASQCKLKLVFKLHPFESIKGHRKLLRRLLPPEMFAQVQWIQGPPDEELWEKVSFAMTVESTIALECTTRGIPVFLCSWLQTTYAGYVQQYAKFRIGHILNSPAEMRNIPELLENMRDFDLAERKIWQPIEPSVLGNLLGGVYPLPTANAS